MNDSIAKMEQSLVAKYGDGVRSDARRGMEQVAEFWRSEDGGAADFEAFVDQNFAGDAATHTAMFDRFEGILEKLSGHMNEIGLACRWQTDLDIGPILPVDEIFAGYEPSAHVLDDFFQDKIAFVVLLNFPLTTLEQRLTDGTQWSRRQWAEARLAQRFSKRIPAEVNLEVAKISSQADQYISTYNIWMHHLVDAKGNRLFPAKMRLLSHWNLRDELKADYADAKNGPAKQRMIQKVMERIITQTIPAAVVDNPGVDWNPYTNEVKPAAVKDADAEASLPKDLTNEREPDTRYAMLLGTYKAAKMVDPYSPTAPTLIARRFDEDREIPEARVHDMLVEIVSSPLAPKVAKLIEKRLGRGLEPFDIWYDGFRSKSAYSPEELDRIVSAKYPTPGAFEKDIPNTLTKLGFPADDAARIAQGIAVDPARGSGHAAGATMRGAKAHLRTRVGANGMDYKGFNIAVHELGHNVEQFLSLNDVDHTLLAGVPNTAFTEALAFVFQSNDLMLLGLEPKRDGKAEALKTLNDFWGVYEIAGVSLVDMAVWHWMYDHPEATPAELREAVITIAKDTWNKYYAPVFEKKDVMLLGVYSHMIDSYLYLPDYAIGHLIANQIEAQIRKAGTIGPEFERMAIYGSVAPDLWMNHATGSVVGTKAMLSAAENALSVIKAGGGK
ncbi:MAG: hypothetical protein PHD74_08695 [Candidatus Krumholzibacteria bacterium]|nr:hypothetical protein [Candidatus Krumholzibacteria bacterium]